MKKVTKYILGAGAVFALGFGACYCLTGDVKGLWNKTKYVANQTQRAMAEYDGKIDYIKPEPLKKIDDAIIEGLHGKTREEIKQEKADRVKKLDDKILKYELDENSDKVISDFFTAGTEYDIFKAKVSQYLKGREPNFPEGSVEHSDIDSLQKKIADYESAAKSLSESTLASIAGTKGESPLELAKNMSTMTTLMRQQIQEDFKYIDSVIGYTSQQKDDESKLVYGESELIKQKRTYFLSMIGEIQSNVEKNLDKAQNAYDKSHKK